MISLIIVAIWLILIASSYASHSSNPSIRQTKIAEDSPLINRVQQFLQSCRQAISRLKSAHRVPSEDINESVDEAMDLSSIKEPSVDEPIESSAQNSKVKPFESYMRWMRKTVSTATNLTRSLATREPGNLQKNEQLKTEITRRRRNKLFNHSEAMDLIRNSFEPVKSVTATLQPRPMDPNSDATSSTAIDPDEPLHDVLRFFYHAWKGVVTTQKELYIYLTSKNSEPSRFSDVSSMTLYCSDAADYSIKIYTPMIFDSIRQYCGIDSESYKSSFNVSDLSTLKADSKSGAGFWRSKDNLLVIKTIKHYECKNLLNVLHLYHKHLLTEPHTCISPVFGLYRVKNRLFGEAKYYMVMKNIYATNPSNASNDSYEYIYSARDGPVDMFAHIEAKIDYDTRRKFMIKYDLKGSTYGRRSKSVSSSDIVYKDLDLIESKVMFQLGKTSRSTLFSTIINDVGFLSACGFMDYSLLVAVDVLGQKSDLQSGGRFSLPNGTMHPVSMAQHDR